MKTENMPFLNSPTFCNILLLKKKEYLKYNNNFATVKFQYLYLWLF